MQNIYYLILFYVSITHILMSQNVETEMYKAQKYITKGEYIEAINIYDLLIDSLKISDTLKNNYIYSLSKLNINIRSNYIDHYLKLFPNDLRALFLQATTYQEKGEFISALDKYMKLFDSLTVLDDVSTNYIVCVNRLVPVEKIKYYKFYNKYYPRDSRVLLALAWIYLENKKYDSSFYLYEKLKNMNLTPKNKETVENNYNYLLPFLTAKEIKFIPSIKDQYPEYRDEQNISIENKLLNRLNYFRSLANLGMVRLKKELSYSALMHSKYLKSNKEETQFEDPFKGNYYGKTFEERIKKTGYNNEDIDENIIIIDIPDESVDFINNSVYHRIPMFAKDLTEVGIGITNEVVVFDYGFEKKNDFMISYCTVYPLENSKNIPLSFKKELPNPIPTEYKIAGAPITLQFSAGRKIHVHEYSLTDNLKKSIDCWVLTPESDRNKLLRKEIAIIPKEPLKNYNKYTIYIKGSVDEINFEKTWSFFTEKEKY